MTSTSASGSPRMGPSLLLSLRFGWESCLILSPARYSSKDILDLLKKHGISDIDVAYRESVVRGFSGLELFAPVSDLDPLNAIIDPVATHSVCPSLA